MGRGCRSFGGSAEGAAVEVLVLFSWILPAFLPTGPADFLAGKIELSDDLRDRLTGVA